ncbi:MAG TPA: LssY C-terminal domain-containing protein [Candidatus Acidoferrum sp.]|nr:LssY C-terminal domain-containing protein [Candidatus Acidoferrum sp.]
MRVLPAKVLGTFLAICVLACGLALAVSRALPAAPLSLPVPQSSAASAAQNTAPPAPTTKLLASQQVQLTGDTTWFDTGIDVHAGERLILSASGTLRYAGQKSDAPPTGIPRGFRDLLLDLPFNGAGRGAVIGRIGDKNSAQPFLVGAKCDLVAPLSGRLSIGINQLSDQTGDGTYTVDIQVYAPAANAVLFTAQQVASIAGVDAQLFRKIPRRVFDRAGDPGDMVNFLILGSQAAMENVFTSAGWVQVDADVTNTLIHGLIESLSKESYLTMPMSPLYLFGRHQDYGWAHAEPISVVASRNHLRIWKAPFDVHGEILWVGAATHDIGFERDQRNNGITHKIDPNVDLERDYVEKTLSSTGLVAQVAHFTPDNPMKDAKTATGGSFHSDGQVLVLKLGERTQE